MITTIAIVTFAVLVLVTLGWALLRHHGPAPDLQTLDTYTRPVDLAAFRNLIDPSEEDYLRGHLPAGKFRSIQRQRMRAALEYVQRTAYNAALLMRVGEAARQSENAEIASAASALVNDALRLRMNAGLAILFLYARIALPGSRISVGRVTDVYESLTAGLLRLTRLQDPAAAPRISAAV